MHFFLFSVFWQTDLFANIEGLDIPSTLEMKVGLKDVFENVQKNDVGLSLLAWSLSNIRSVAGVMVDWNVIERWEIACRRLIIPSQVTSEKKIIYILLTLVDLELLPFVG